MTTQTEVDQASATPELTNCPIELLDGSVADVERALPTAANLDELLAAETAGKTRKGVISAITAEQDKRTAATATATATAADSDSTDAEPEAEPAKFAPCVALVKKYGDKTPVQVTSAEQLAKLQQIHGAENVEVQA